MMLYQSEKKQNLNITKIPNSRLQTQPFPIQNTIILPQSKTIRFILSKPLILPPRVRRIRQLSICPQTQPSHVWQTLLLRRKNDGTGKTDRRKAGRDQRRRLGYYGLPENSI